MLGALSLFCTPLAYARQTLSSATNLGCSLPFLDDARSPRGCSASIDLFYIWWMVSLSIGLGVLYRRRTAPIATTLIAVYGVIGLVIAAIKTAASGA